MDIEKVIAGLTMLVDRKNDDTCEGLKCCKIAEDALAMLKKQEEEIENLKQTCQSMMEGVCLLKEQNAVKPKYKERMGGFVAGLCPTCGTALNNVLNVKACGKCGQAVKWE